MGKDQEPGKGGERPGFNVARPMFWGWMLLILGFGGFMSWALWIPLDSGVSAAATVVLSGHRKVVQPLVGGRISELKVRDGDVVKAGQVLAQLDDTQSRTQLAIARGQWMAASAQEARLMAERAGRQRVEFPPSLLAYRGETRAAEAMALQVQLFATRRDGLRSELASIDENMRGLELQAEGVAASRGAREQQHRLLSGEIERQRQLASEGFLARNRVSEQERLLASLGGSIAEDLGTVGRIRQSIAELRVRKLARQQEVRKEVETQLDEVQREIAALNLRMDGLKFEVESSLITSPSEGVVLGLTVHTVGGVVAAGNALMEIVPRGDRLTVEAQIAPHLIDKVKPGLEVDVLFTAFNQATTPHVPGRVTSVSADALADPRQNLSYFKALVEVTPDGMARLKQHEIRAGMPAEVLIRTGERTAMNYLLKPLLDRMNRALVEP